ncbi:MAG: trigger factor, partial [Burkholderiaceae bacterium]|nr:trigger factor [Burkholderiaceae bacterium]
MTKEAVVQIENLGSLDRKMTLQFNRADINQAREARLTKISKSMKMPGFRPGKVPKKMVEQQYGMQVDFEVQYDKATQLFYELSKQEGLKLASQPRLEPKSEIDADEIVFDAFFEVLPEVKIGDFSASELTRYTTEVNDPEIDRALDVLRKQRVHYHSRGEAGDHGDGGSDTSAQKDDQVTIDFVGKIDGVEFAGGKADDFQFVIGAGQMLP